MSEQFGIKISDLGKEVVSAGVDDLIFSSEYPTLSIRKKVSLTVTTSAVDPGTGSNTYEHNFGYIPQMIAFVTTADYTGYPSSYINVPAFWVCPNDSGGTDPGTRAMSAETFNCYSNTTTVTVTASANVNDGFDDIEYLSNVYVFDILLFMEEALLT